MEEELEEEEHKEEIGMEEIEEIKESVDTFERVLKEDQIKNENFERKKSSLIAKIDSLDMFLLSLAKGRIRRKEQLDKLKKSLPNFEQEYKDGLVDRRFYDLMREIIFTVDDPLVELSTKLKDLTRTGFNQVCDLVNLSRFANDTNMLFNRMENIVKSLGETNKQYYDSMVAINKSSYEAIGKEMEFYKRFFPPMLTIMKAIAEADVVKLPEENKELKNEIERLQTDAEAKETTINTQKEEIKELKKPEGGENNGDETKIDEDVNNIVNDEELSIEDKVRKLSKLGKTQIEIAELVKKSQQTISNILKK